MLYGFAYVSMAWALGQVDVHTIMVCEALGRFVCMRLHNIEPIYTFSWALMRFAPSFGTPQLAPSANYNGTPLTPFILLPRCAGQFP